MVIVTRRPAARAGFLIIDALVGMAILLIAVLPLAYGFRAEANLMRATYQRAVAMELVDGELEILAAGAWRQIPEGTSDYPVHGHAAANLPDGKFLVTRHGNQVRLEWSPAAHSGVGPVEREANVK